MRKLLTDKILFSIGIRAKGWTMYGMESNLKFGDQIKNFKTIKTGFNHMCDEIFNINRFIW